MKCLVKPISFILILTAITCESSYSQTINFPSEENKLVNLYSKLISFSQADFDSLSFYSEKFEVEFTQLIQTHPASMDYPFKRLADSNFCNVVTSSDGQFRVYSWDTRSGGTMHFFKTLYQWRSNGTIFFEVPNYEEGDPGSFCSKLYTVNIHDIPYYLTVTNSIFSSKEAQQSISAYAIIGGKLVDTVNLFKAKQKTFNSIDVNFDFFSVVDRPERPLELITYDDKKQTIYIPVVNDKGQVSKKYILYRLNGTCFEYIGIE